MSNKVIMLEFESTLSRLAGNEYGYDTYKNYVEGKLDYSSINTIVFPDEIKDVAISFVQGFARDIIKDKSADYFFQIVEIKGAARVVQKFKDAIYF